MESESIGIQCLPKICSILPKLNSYHKIQRVNLRLDNGLIPSSSFSAPFDKKPIFRSKSLQQPYKAYEKLNLRESCISGINLDNLPTLKKSKYHPHSKSTHLIFGQRNNSLPISKKSLAEIRKNHIKLKIPSMIIPHLVLEENKDENIEKYLPKIKVNMIGPMRLNSIIKSTKVRKINENTGSNETRKSSIIDYELLPKIEQFEKNKMKHLKELFNRKKSCPINFMNKNNENTRNSVRNETRKTISIKKGKTIDNESNINIKQNKNKVEIALSLAKYMKVEDSEVPTPWENPTTPDLL